jgi:hypothetical protein
MKGFTATLALCLATYTVARPASHGEIAAALADLGVNVASISWLNLTSADRCLRAVRSNLLGGHSN